jgi:outer membrane protein TolC
MKPGIIAMKTSTLVRLAAFLPGCIALVLVLIVIAGANAYAIGPVGDNAEAGPTEIKGAAAPATLKGLIQYAVENNPRLKAARFKWKSVIEKYPQAVSYDDPMLTYTYTVEEIETRLGPVNSMLMLSQKIPFPGKLGLKGRIVEKEIDIAKTEYDLVLRNLSTVVKKAFYELYYIDKATVLAKENDAVLEYFAEVSRVNYGLDTSGLDELVRSRKMSAKASLDLIMLDDMREGALARINTLLNLDPESPIGPLEEPRLRSFEYSLDELYRWAVTNYEALKIAGLKVEKSELQTRLSKYKYLPDFRIGLNYSEIGDPPMAVTDAGRDAVAVTFGINIPIWFSKNRAAVNQSNINRERSLMEKGAVLSELENEVKRVYFNLTSAERIVKLYGESLIPEARESLGFAEARYKTGKEMLGRILETQSLWINFRLVYYRAFANYLKSVAELERLTAREL